MKFALIGMAVVAFAAGNAQAAIVDLTWTGVVNTDNGETDIEGTFGAVGADLSGAAFVSTYRFNTAFGADTYQTNGFTDRYGGSSTAYSNPLVAASITINGHTVAFTGSYASELTSKYTPQYQIYSEADDDARKLIYNYVEGMANLGYATRDFANFSGDVSALAGYGFYNSSDRNGTNLQLQNQYLTITTTGAVPEPASWAMMLGGFGLIGGAMRGRRRVAVSYS